MDSVLFVGGWDWGDANWQIEVDRQHHSDGAPSNVTLLTVKQKSQRSDRDGPRNISTYPAFSPAAGRLAEAGLYVSSSRRLG